MARIYKPVDLGKIKKYSAQRRKHKSSVESMAALPEAGAKASELIDSFPSYLGAVALRNVVRAIVAAVEKDRPVVFAFGAHVLKVGCGPIFVDLIRRGVSVILSVIHTSSRAAQSARDPGQSSQRHKTPSRLSGSLNPAPAFSQRVRSAGRSRPSACV